LTQGINVESAASYSAVPFVTVPVTAATVFLTNSGPADLNGGDPEVQTGNISAGTRVTIIQTGGGTTTFRNTSNDATSKLKLSNASHTLGQYDALTLIFTGTFWVQVGFENN
jgi:hypothetical protein